MGRHTRIHNYADELRRRTENGQIFGLQAMDPGASPNFALPLEAEERTRPMAQALKTALANMALRSSGVETQISL